MGKSSGMERKTKVYFVNPPFKAEYGKFSRENRSPAVTRSGTLYYPLWLIYAAAICEKDGFPIEFLDAPAGQMDKKTALERIAENGAETKLFVVSTSTPSGKQDPPCRNPSLCITGGNAGNQRENRFCCTEGIRLYCQRYCKSPRRGTGPLQGGRDHLPKGRGDQIESGYALYHRPG